MARTKLSEYQKYLNRRRRLEAEGYSLKEESSKGTFEQYAKLIENDVKAGRLSIKNIGVYVANDDKTFNKSQVNKLKKGLNDMYKDLGLSKRVTVKDLYAYTKDIIDDIKDFNVWKQDKILIGGHYE